MRKEYPHVVTVEQMREMLGVRAKIRDSKGADTVPKGAQTYRMIFKEYPDVVSVEQMCDMLSISTKTGYQLLKEKRIRSFVIGRTYRIPKLHILEYMNVIQNAESSGKYVT